MLTEEQINAMVKKKYPKTEKESYCASEKKLREDKRNWYRQILRERQIDVPTLN